MAERDSLHVVLGTGPLGLAVARYLVTRGDRVRVVNRSGRADLPGSIDILAADVTEVAEAKRGCDGGTVIYHCANPPYGAMAGVAPAAHGLHHRGSDRRRGQ